MPDRGTILYSIGIWEELDRFPNQYPHPRVLVNKNVTKDDRTTLAEYLQGGHTLASYLGYSWCRFDCGVADSQMGCRSLTDGTWAWPEGLPHYILEHDVWLPDPVIRSMAANNWQVPDLDWPLWSDDPNYEPEFATLQGRYKWPDDLAKDETRWLGWFDGSPG